MSLRPLLWKLLLVDDDQDDYIIFNDLINQARGGKVSLEWASSYESGEQLLNTNQYDAVFVDYYLGRKNGIKLIRKTIERNYPAPIILLTGCGSYEVDLEAMNAGATFYLTKDEINPMSLERFIRYAIERKKAEEALREQKVQIELHHRLLEHREQERQSIARDLHDGPIQDLLAMLLDLRHKQDCIADPELQSELNSIELRLNSAIQGLRDLINEIRPPYLIRFGLAKAMQLYLNDLKCQHPEIEITMSVADGSNCLPEQAHISLFRILQEAIANAIKHSHTKRIEVTWDQQDDQCVLKIHDEGQGFIMSESLIDYSSCGHYGLVGMKERAEAIGAKLSITSEPGAGTTIMVIITENLPSSPRK